MSNVCFYFQIHQPWRLRNYPVFDIGNKRKYFETEKEAGYDNERVAKKVADKSYRPMMKLLLDVLKNNPNFKFSLSVTGVAVEQFQKYTPDVIDLLKKIAESGRVEFLAETYYHSLSSLYSPTEFLMQVSAHHRMIEDLFGVTPKVFRNTELIYTNDIAKMVQEAGYKAMLAEGAGRVLQGRKPTKLYSSPSGLPLLLKHYMLSDDIAFRFSESSRSDKPLTADTFSHWISSSFGDDEVVNLFMDFETFGEHQWVDTGIFEFFKHFAHKYTDTGNKFVLPSEVIKKIPVDVFDSNDPVSWADVDRDITAWRGNNLQYDALSVIYSLERDILNSGNEELIEDWRKMQTSDHFYYMCTKWANDGDVHAYFSPYGSPYNAYTNYNNCLSDLKWRVNQINKNG